MPATHFRLKIIANMLPPPRFGGSFSCELKMAPANPREKCALKFVTPNHKLTTMIGDPPAPPPSAPDE